MTLKGPLTCAESEFFVRLWKERILCAELFSAIQTQPHVDLAMKIRLALRAKLPIVVLY